MIIIYPTTTTGNHELFTDVKSQDAALGARSPIKNVMAEKGINLADDISTIDNAASHDHSASLYRKNAKAYGQLSDNKAKPAMKVAANIGQLIKSTNKNDLAVVGEWGFNITNSGKITLPTNAADRVLLFENLIAKHASYPAGTSPIDQFLIDKDIDLGKLKDALVESQNLERQSKRTYELAENETQQRDILMAPVLEHAKIIGSFLMEYYKDEQRRVGEWGFNVEEPKSKPTEQTSKIKLLQTLTINSVIIGGEVINVGPTDIHIYKGKTTTGNPVILHPGDKWGVPKKHSIITISNPSNLETAIVKVLVRKH